MATNAYTISFAESNVAFRDPSEGSITVSTEPGDSHHTLFAVLRSAFLQAAAGKGHERHAQGLPFEEQPMQTISNLVGSMDGMAYQAIKKVQEALRLPTPDRQKAELLGAINYIAGMVIFIEARESIINNKLVRAEDIARENGSI